MGNPHSYTTKYVAIKAQLEAATKPLRSAKARKQAMKLAAMGRPADLAEQARVSLALRRIAGFPARRAALMQGGSGNG